ncbi:MAG: GNAT family N-acetyltransferase [Cetobacterium sp.]|uniref:GNAT family N-acetyltransferase n=1 Tax=Cetobacterium sp. ZWU0022 TaxID=1340502 RepID=UPI000646141A|nr:GNAT family N-acetyltransferase [Cetobacterium sp. ZWU0022]
MIIKKMSESEAREVVSWKYEGRYSVYNYPTWKELCELKWGIVIKEKREKEFYTVFDKEKVLYAYIRFQKKDEYYLIGLGLKPEVCGKGEGDILMELIKNIAALLNENIKLLKLEVRTFNKRAIKCYLKAGFRYESKYFKTTITGVEEFYTMSLEL